MKSLKLNQWSSEKGFQQTSLDKIRQLSVISLKFKLHNIVRSNHDNFVVKLLCGLQGSFVNELLGDAFYAFMLALNLLDT
jgi:hypothetical protein